MFDCWNPFIFSCFDICMNLNHPQPLFCMQLAYSFMEERVMLNRKPFHFRVEGGAAQLCWFMFTHFAKFDIFTKAQFLDQLSSFALMLLNQCHFYHPWLGMVYIYHLWKWWWLGDGKSPVESPGIPPMVTGGTVAWWHFLFDVGSCAGETSSKKIDFTCT